jgi:GNAT superfamily N-acetyltransferase
MKPFMLTIEHDPKSEDVDFLNHSLIGFNTSRVEIDDYQPLTILLRDEQQTVIGGVIASTYWEWLYIDVLFVQEELRSQGYGAVLLDAAEQEAGNRGCLHAYLDTFSFQTPNFYINRGYHVFGELPNFPTGHTRYFLRKDL